MAEENRVYRQYKWAAPAGACQIVLVRHGESQPEDPERPFPVVDGQGDPPLDPVGEDQARRVAKRLGDEDITAIYVTNLQRTAQTAAPLATLLGLTPRVEPDLREVHLGEWELSFRRKMAEGGEIAQQVATGRWDAIPGAESSDDFVKRLQAGINRIAAAHPDEKVVVVSHGAAIGQILALATGARAFSMSSDNAAIHQLVVTEDRWIVRGFNDNNHLR